MIRWAEAGGAARARVASVIVAAIAAALLASSVLGTTLAGRVVAVHDGDTITVLVERREVRVRLARIDAPERGQAYASAARRALADRIAARTVLVEVHGRDDYGRTLATVCVDDVDVNSAQVADGWAWVFRRYSRDAALIALEDAARRERRGLWRDAHPQPPWQWRARHGRVRPPAGTAPGR